MDDQTLRLECLKLANGDLSRAQSFYGWLLGEEQISNLITAKMIERELVRMTEKPCTVTEGKDGMFLVVVDGKGKAVRFTDSDRSMSMNDFSDQVLKAVVEKFA